MLKWAVQNNLPLVAIPRMLLQDVHLLPPHFSPRICDGDKTPTPQLAQIEDITASALLQQHHQRSALGNITLPRATHQ
jgi:hypothetical protein